MSRRSWLVAAVAATAGLLLAACGAAGVALPKMSTKAGPNVATLSRQALAAMKGARSVHVTGSAAEGGQNVVMDVILIRAGGLSGKLTSNGHTVEVLTSGSHLYIAVTRSLARWQKFPPGVCALMCGKWLKEPSGDLHTIVGDFNWTKLFGSFEHAFAVETANYAGTATVAGQPTLKLNFPGDGTAYVAAHGTPYMLRIQGGPGQLTFTDWNTATLPSPPRGSRVVTPGQLAGG